MHPPYSVIFFTTLAGAGQGLFLALLIAQVYTGSTDVMTLPKGYYVAGTLISLILLGAGLLASFFHLGHPERAWRAAAMWRTSWLSREVIALPAFMGAVFLYGAAHFLDAGTGATLAIGLIGTVLCFALFVSTGMIYACLSFLREWATPLTLVNFTLLGTASGFILAAAYSVFTGEQMVAIFGWIGFILTIGGLITRSATLIRNARLKPKSTTQTALGVRHPKVTQRSQGQMGGSYNTREFFHGKSAAFIRQIKTLFIVFGFVVPAVLVWIGLTASQPLLFPLAFIIQYLGFLAERWYFFAQVNHPQNLYYQTIS